LNSPGSYGPPIGKIYRTYFGYTILLCMVPAICSYIIQTIFSYTVPAFIYYASPSFLYSLQLFILLLFMMIFPTMAVGVKPDLLRAFRLLRGNRFRLAVVLLLTTIVPIALTDVLYYFTDLIYGGSRYLAALIIVLYIAMHLVLLGLWACCVTLCYYHVTGRQSLVAETGSGQM
jgi:hypothetical protein